MPSFIIGLSGNNHLRIEVLPSPYRDWVEAYVSVRAESFTGQFQAHYASNDFAYLRDGLTRLNKKVFATFVFEPLEGQVRLKFVGSERGSISVECWAQESIDGRYCTIEWQIEIDQSYLPPILRDLDEIIALGS